MNHNSNRYDDSPDSWPIRSSCGGGCGGGMSRMGVSQMPQRWDESWQPDYVPRASATPRMPMSRFYPDEQPDAVTPVFSRAGVARPVQPRYDDSPDSPSFYAPRIPQMMQSPGMPMQQRPWDDGPDSPNFYGARIPQAIQPPGIQMQRPWDDGPDTDNFYRPGSSSPHEMPAVTTRPWDDGPDTDNFYKNQVLSSTVRAIVSARPWDDGPDTDLFYKRRYFHTGEIQTVPRKAWNDFSNSSTSVSGSFLRAKSLLQKIIASDLNRTNQSSFDLVTNQVVQKVLDSIFSEQMNSGSNKNSILFAGVDRFGHGMQSYPLIVSAKSFGPLPLGDYQKIYPFQTHAFYGRSVGFARTAKYRFDKDENKGCSSWTFGGPFVATASHCGDPDLWPAPDLRMIATFGLFTTSYEPPNSYILGKQYAFDRLQDLGILNTQESLGAKQLHSFECLNIKDYSPDRLSDGVDLAIYQCKPNMFTYKIQTIGGNVTSGSILLYPSHLYGYLPIWFEAAPNDITQSSLDKKGREASILAHNFLPKTMIGTKTISFDDTHQVYLSPTDVVDIENVYGRYNQRPMFVSEGGWYYEGSSGGALFDNQTNKTLGVLSDGTTNNDFRSRFQVIPINVEGFKLNSLILDNNFIKARSYIIAKSVGDISSAGSDLFGKPQDLFCPSGFAAAGIIGSSLSPAVFHAPGTSGPDRLEDQFIGNLGLICLPFGDHSRQLPESIRSQHSSIPNIVTPPLSAFSYARVIAGGSLDTGLISGDIDFNQYYNEVLSSGTAFLNPKKLSYIPFNGLMQQNFSMCAPGYFLGGLWASSIPFSTKGSDQLLERIILMKCVHEKSDRFYYNVPRVKIGANDNDFSQNITVSRSNIQNFPVCGEDSVVNGMRIKSGWFSSGFGLFCKNKPK